MVEGRFLLEPPVTLSEPFGTQLQVCTSCDWTGHQTEKSPRCVVVQSILVALRNWETFLRRQCSSGGSFNIVT
jgi:hypothetical protein